MDRYKFEYHGQTVYSAKLDVVFKALFTGGDLTLLASFLSAVLDMDICASALKVTNSELTPGEKKGKLYRLDILAETADGKQIDIEIQLTRKRNLEKRMLHYLSRMFGKRLKIGENYEISRTTIVIAILDFAYFPYEEYHNIYRMKNTRTGDELTNEFDINFNRLLS